MGCNEDRVLALATALGWAADTGVHRCKSIRRRQLECAALKSLRRRFEGCGTAEDRHSAGRGTVGESTNVLRRFCHQKCGKGRALNLLRPSLLPPKTNVCFTFFSTPPPPPHLCRFGPGPLGQQTSTNESVVVAVCDHHIHHREFVCCDEGLSDSEGGPKNTRCL